MSVVNNEVSKAFPYSSYIPFYFNGLGISNNVALPLVKLDVAAGSCLDSTGTFQIGLSSSVTISIANNGLNGLDTGTIAASTMYAVYLVADPVTQQASGCMLSLASNSVPLLPFGYSAYALIGYVAIDASSHILPGYWSDNDSARRLFVYDAIQATAITAGSSSTYANVNLISLVPNVNNTLVKVYTDFNANAAADVLGLQAGNATGDEMLIIAPVAGSSAHTATMSEILAQPVTISSVSSPVINYKVSAGTVAVDVAGYYFDL